MKPLLLSILLLITASGMGQKKTIKTNNGLIGMIDSTYTYDEYDTVRLYLLVADSSRDMSDLFAVKGYAVRQNEPSFDNWECGLNACMGWRDHYYYVQYLDVDKKPFRYLMVWMTKTIEK